MGRLLAALIEDFEIVPAATLATPATPVPVHVGKVAKSQESQVAAASAWRSDAAAIRAELKALALDELIDARVVDSLSAADLDTWKPLSKPELRALAFVLRDADLRAKGKRPPDETAPAFCRKCGPVWLAPEVVAVAPTIQGWPTVLGCPWCHVRSQGIGIPRPSVFCGTCSHLERDKINPSGGMGHCNAGVISGPLPYPHVQRQCERFEPKVAG